MKTLQTLLPEHFKTLKPFFAHQPFRLSSYSLPLLFEWQHVDGFEIRFAIEDENLFLAAENTIRPTNCHLALPLPAERFPPRRLAEVSREWGFTCLWFVPEAYLEAHGRAEVEAFYAVEEQTKLADYVYRTQDLAELSGRRYAKKRNLIKQFEREYVEAGRVSFEAIGPQNIAECTHFLEEWCYDQNCTQSEQHLLACDREATLNALASFEQLELEGLAVRVDRKLSGIGVAARLTENMGVFNIEKAFAWHKGLYQYFDRECVRRLFASKYEWINKESDMGVEGLMQAKRSYFPAEMIRCFKLSLR